MVVSCPTAEEVVLDHLEGEVVDTVPGIVQNQNRFGWVRLRETATVGRGQIAEQKTCASRPAH